MKKHFIIISAIIIFTFTIVAFSIYQTRKIDRDSLQTVPAVVVEELKPPQPRQLIPDRPEDYGMVVISAFNSPKTQGEWDDFLSGKIKELKAQVPAETWNKIDQKIEEEPQKTEDKIKQIDAGVTACVELLGKDPENQEVKEKLERLMILRSIAKELP